MGDNADVFPNDDSETADSDGDGVGDNADAFPDDSSKTTLQDRDGDGVEDDNDAFPDDDSETTDSDGDGVGDNADAFPDDDSETTDTDGDGVGDNADAFPNDDSETTDTDGDGVGDNADFYPNNPERHLEGVEITIRYAYNEDGGAMPTSVVETQLIIDKNSNPQTITYSFVSTDKDQTIVNFAGITSPGTTLQVLTLTNRQVVDVSASNPSKPWEIQYDFEVPGTDENGQWI